MSNRTIIIKRRPDNQATIENLSGATVKVYQNSNLITTLTSNGDGEVSFNFTDNLEYILHVLPPATFIGLLDFKVNYFPDIQIPNQIILHPAARKLIPVDMRIFKSNNDPFPDCKLQFRQFPMSRSFVEQLTDNNGRVQTKIPVRFRELNEANDRTIQFHLLSPVINGQRHVIFEIFYEISISLAEFINEIKLNNFSETGLPIT